MKRDSSMVSALKAGVTYFAIVYLAGFVLGTLRVVLIAPRFGETAAVLLETPIILAVSWFAARWCTATFSVPNDVARRLLMGGVAFCLLILGELGISLFVFARSWEHTLATFLSRTGLIGLGAQVVFALLPPIQAVLERKRR